MSSFKTSPAYALIHSNNRVSLVFISDDGGREGERERPHIREVSSSRNYTTIVFVYYYYYLFI